MDGAAGVTPKERIQEPNVYANTRFPYLYGTSVRCQNTGNVHFLTGFHVFGM